MDPRDPEQLLARALEAARAGEDEAALAALVEAWGASHAAELVPAIDAIAGRIDERRPPLDGRGQRDAWVAVAKARDPADVGRLLASFAGDANLLGYRLGWLASFPPDPRIARAIIGLLDRPPRGRRMREFCQELVEKAAGLDDPAVAERLAVLATAARPRSPRDRPPLANRGSRVREALLEAGEHLAQNPPAPPIPLSAAAVAIAAELAGPARDATRRARHARDAAELLAEVYANPDDDGPRLVYADLLGENGDPRGEFIVMQIERERTGAKVSARERALERQWQRAWLGPLEPCALRQGIVYRRGFVWALAHGPQACAPGEPAWATVGELTVRSARYHPEGVGAYLCAPELRSLQRVVGLSTFELIRLSRAGKTLSDRITDVELEGYADPAVLDVIPGVRRLGWDLALTEEMLRALVAIPRLERVTAGIGQLDAARRALDAAHPGLEELRLSGHNLEARFRRVAAGWALELESTARTWPQGVARRIVRLLSELAPGQLAALSVTTWPKLVFDATERSRLDAEIRRVSGR